LLNTISSTESHNRREVYWIWWLVEALLQRNRSCRRKYLSAGGKEICDPKWGSEYVLVASTAIQGIMKVILKQQRSANIGPRWRSLSYRPINHRILHSNIHGHIQALKVAANESIATTDPSTGSCSPKHSYAADTKNKSKKHKSETDKREKKDKKDKKKKKKKKKKSKECTAPPP
jgi:hypothetical protein